jgi:hypothetical protein
MKPETIKENAAESRLASLERENSRQRDEINRLRRMSDNLRRELEGCESRIAEVLNSVPAFTPTIIKTRAKPKPSEATAVACWSDWHYEERIDPKTIHGLNEHSRSICTDRVKLLVSKTLEQVRMFRSVHKIKKIVVWLGGDMISGDIHDELLETCEVPPAVAVVEVSQLIADSIETICREGEFDEIEIICNDGNHSRTTKKLRVAMRTGHSWEWVMYSMLANGFRKYPRMRWIIADGEQVIHPIQGRDWRFLHGDTIRYQGGVGGLTIPANKAVSQWNKARPCYHTVFGHWHQRTPHRWWTTNGSSVGYSPFAQAIKAEYEPPMQSLIICDDSGIRQNTAIQLATGTV